MTHRRIATATATGDLATIVAAIDASDADLTEVRLDALWPTVPDADRATDDLTALVATEKPLLATLRPKRQGGGFDGDEQVRLGLLIAAARAGFDAIDLEADLRPLHDIAAAARSEADVVLSDHSLHAAPSRQDGLLRLQMMQDEKAILDKFAVPVGSFADTLRVLELVHAHRARHGNPAIAPLGGGPMLRALLALIGNGATYGHVGTPAVAGQPALADVDAVWDHWGIGSDDLGQHIPWYAVLGSPVEHSLSPRIHNAALRAAGRPERFGALDVPDSVGAYRLLATVASRMGLVGASVTMPLKQHAASVMKGDAIVQATGAANCVRFTDGAATNTDATALRRLLDGSGRVGVLGGGGAARAALWAAHDLGLDATVTCRRADIGEPLARRFGATYTPWDERASIDADAWIQATPLTTGVLPDEPVAGSRVIELVYKDGATDLERAAAQAVSGRDFLIEQAVDAYSFWTGHEPDRAAMERA